MPKCVWSIGVKMFIITSFKEHIIFRLSYFF